MKSLVPRQLFAHIGTKETLVTLNQPSNEFNVFKRTNTDQSGSTLKDSFNESTVGVGTTDLKDLEHQAAHLEHLGRQRPTRFSSTWKEAGFVYAVVMSQVLTEYFVSGFNVVIPTIINELDIAPAKQTWPAASFPLVVSAFLLPCGRLSDMHGGYPVYVAGVSWLMIWSIAAGFCHDELLLTLCRALQGLGPAAFLPSSFMLLGSIYRPGPRKNLIFALYGAAAPLGFYLGILIAGVCAQYLSWSVYFWIGAGITASTAVVAYFTIPSDIEERKRMGVQMDWVGTILIPAGLILIVFAITDSAHAPKGWATPYLGPLLEAGLSLIAFVIYYEGWVSVAPLVPPSIFSKKYMKPLFLSLFFSYGSFGIFMLYSTFYMTNVMGATPLQLVAWFSPMAVGGCVISIAGGEVLHRVNNTIMLIIAGCGYIVAPLLFAIAPPGANYWYYVFWSMLATTIGIDTTFTITNVFITSSVPLRQQGVAGGMINSVLHLAMALFLALADVVTISESSNGQLHSYRVVFWFELAAAAVALFVMVGFVRVGKASSGLTADEQEQSVVESTTCTARESTLKGRR